MTELAVTKGTFADIKTVKTRSVAQIIIEVPIEDINMALKALGGYPQPGKEPWVAVAVLTEQAAPSASGDALPSERSGKVHPLVKSAGMLPSASGFIEYAQLLGTDPVKLIHEKCGIESRRELAWNEQAQTKYRQLFGRYQEWQRTGEAA